MPSFPPPPEQNYQTNDISDINNPTPKYHDFYPVQLL